MPEAIFFDLDDTILDFTGPAGPAWQTTVMHHAGHYGGIEPATVLASIHGVSRAWWSDPDRHRIGRLDLQATRARNVSDALTELGIADDGLAERIADTFAQLRTEALQLFPGAWETLHHFQQNRVPMALLTNGASVGQRHKIDRFELAGFFDCILIEQEFGVGKPDERVFRHALDSLGHPSTHTWMVGDNLQWEIEPCRNLGMHTVWVDARREGLPADTTIEPHRIVQNINELIEA